jgi:cytochrome c-type biogenesis protein CcmE
MKRKQRRLVLIGVALAVLGAATALVLSALRESVVFFHSPTEVIADKLGPGTRLRIGGLVKPGSLERDGAFTVRFEVTDGHAAVPVAYTGALPDLFREGQGVVAEGVLGADGRFKADTVLAKHDERYMPKEVADALKRQGRWNEGSAGAVPAGMARGRP